MRTISLFCRAHVCAHNIAAAVTRQLYGLPQLRYGLILFFGKMVVRMFMGKDFFAAGRSSGGARVLTCLLVSAEGEMMGEGRPTRRQANVSSQ
jgi:hypothetical protein